MAVWLLTIQPFIHKVLNLPIRYNLNSARVIYGIAGVFANPATYTLILINYWFAIFLIQCIAL